jgi:hypothetical protein
MPGSTRAYELEDLHELRVVKKVGSKYEIMPELKQRIAMLASYWRG